MANASLKPIHVGLLGIGTVGGGTFDVLRRNQEEITRRAGRASASRWSPTRTLDRAREATASARRTSTDRRRTRSCRASRHRHRRRADRRHRAVAQAIWCCEAIANGKHVVTANKALLAHARQRDLRRGAEEGRDGGVRGAVAGGIPIIKALREGLTANRIEWIAGHHQRHLATSSCRRCATRALPFDDGAEGGAARWATPRPTRPSTSRASTPRTSSPSCRRSPSASRCSSTRPTPKASRS